MNEEITICKNCGHQFQFKYCNQCGQSANTHRIDWKELLYHLPHAIFHINKSLFFSLLELVYRPGHSIREYLQGKRKDHINPFTMLILIGALCSILYVHFQLRTVLASVNLHDLEHEQATLTHKYFAVRTIFFCLLCSLGDFIFFRKKKYNLPEVIVTNVYTFCGVSVIQLLFIPLLLFARSLGMYEYAIFFIVPPVLSYLIFVRFQFYEVGHNRKMQVKIIAIVIFYFLMVLIVGQKLVKPFFQY